MAPLGAEEERMLTGRCNCGEITFRVTGTPEDAALCHCGQCRKQSGHVWASAHVPLDALDVSGTPVWYEASPKARRGFCGTCGSFLFWRQHDEARISFALGALDGPTGLVLEKHIFVRDKGDYYDIADGVPQEP
jgi:hypothetical protein